MNAITKQPSAGTAGAEATQDGQLDAAEVRAAAERAAARIAPLWPLQSFVAVNPFLGLAEQTFDQAAETLARAAGARMTMPRAFYLDAIASGRIADADLDAALAEVPPGEGRPADAAALIAEARRGDAPAPSPSPTVADVVSERTQREWAGFAVERISAFCADRFDEGQASWPSPAGDQAPYAAWRQVASVERTPEVMGLRGFRAAVRRLPEDAEGVLRAAPHRLGLDAAGLEAYFHRLLMTIGGWAAFARYKVWQSDLDERADGILLDLLAIRVAWDVVLHELFAEHAGVDAAWRQAAAHYAGPAIPYAGPSIDGLLQSAYEKAWQRRLVAAFESPKPTASRSPVAVQAAFCIDVRSEVFRRALEGVAPAVGTIGFAGFFGVPIEYVPLGHRHGKAHCPVLLKPSLTIQEAVSGADDDEEAAVLWLRRMRRRAAKAWKGFKLAAVASFAFVETVGLAYLGKLLSDGLGLSRTVPHPSADGIDRNVRPRLAPRIAVGEAEGRITGIPAAKRLDLAEAVLTAMSLTDGFARLVMLAGHGASTVNNPHASGLDCGACGGHSGEANARVAAAILNDPAVRAGLRDRGIAIPEDTVFVAALHDTTTDRVRLFDEDTVPASHAEDIAALKGWLDEAGRRARAERAALLPIDPARPVDAQIMARSTDWAQVRPEWGLAGCAAFVAAPRQRTAGHDLGGRAFLHDYDWRQDDGFRTLELIMTAPMVVASWISLQYFGSTVDNRVFGSGNKVLHNVVGTVGVLEGNGGDLRTGLPWQSVHDGDRLIHEPLRLSVVIEAPRDAINEVISRHAAVRQLVDNGWLHLFAIDDAGRIAWRYAGGLAWEPTV